MRKLLLSLVALAFLSSNLFAWGFPVLTNPTQIQQIIFNCKNTQKNGTTKQRLYAQALCAQYGVDTMLYETIN
ncbi:hypothetical protein [uncultured Campylobacter sp.]|uniref:hypothetical protein n=1 Tax=uncultured Campylobacter sp. TaxID=218934 RepID=UPI002612A779|nr:hypothetical protein [uncultured Campylobacter sp.]